MTARGKRNCGRKEKISDTTINKNVGYITFTPTVPTVAFVPPLPPSHLSITPVALTTGRSPRRPGLFARCDDRSLPGELRTALTPC
jgi:hypothetical protein